MSREFIYLRIYDIDWDTDGVEIGLPTELEVEWVDDWTENFPPSVDEIGDWLSDEFGWCVNGFCIRKVSLMDDGIKFELFSEYSGEGE
jgi:hypothetical protein|tara:strand:+ start:100 stop:363 length:264 start_codon:yes stop_codon:yes gene_type:complete